MCYAIYEPSQKLSAMKIKNKMFSLLLKNDLEALSSSQKGLEALQAACGNGNFNLPFSFPLPSAFLPPHHHSQNSHTLPGGGGSGDGGGGGGGNAMISSASSHSSESSQSSARNGIETTRERDSSNHSQNNSQGNSHQQQTSWSFEEQFKQVRQASTFTTPLPNAHGSLLPFF